MRIMTNIASMGASNSLDNIAKSLKASVEKLSSGLRINKASDDASGLAIADKLRTQKNSVSQSIDNALSAVAMLQIADKGMNEQSNILDVIKTKLIQAGTATTSDDGRKAISKDINKLLTQLDNIAGQTNYNGIYLLQYDSVSKNSANQLAFQIGEFSDDIISTSGTIQSNTLGLASSAPLDKLSDLKNDTSGGGGLTKDLAISYLSVIDLALTDLNAMRSDFGSTINQIESSMRNMLTTKTNIANAESIIRDVDYGYETASFSKYNVMSNAGSYAFSQANTFQDSVMMVLNTSGN